MKKIVFSAITLIFLFSMAIITTRSLAGRYNCYTCRGGGYVCFNGSDTFDKRKKAKDNHACEISGTSSCEDYHCKGKFVN